MTEVNLFVTTLLNGIWEGAFLAMAMWLFLKLVPRLNPTTRFWVLWATLLAIVVLLLGPFTPKAAAPVSDSPLTRAATAAAILSPARSEAPGSSDEDQITASPSRPLTVTKSTARPASPSTSLVQQQASSFVATQTAPSQGGSIQLSSLWHPLIPIHSDRILIVFEILWLALSLFMLMRLGLGYWKLQGMKAKAAPIQGEWKIRLRALQDRNGVRRQTQLLVSSHVTAPMSLGFLHPAILIPRKLFDTLSVSELEHVVLHELGHLHRRDDWTNLALRFIEAILPVQPAVYWIGHRMSLEREMACDDWVIAATGAAEPYATSLTRVAELSSWARADLLAAGATGNRSQLFSRVDHMLDRTRNRAPRLTLAPMGAAIASIGILIFLGARAPRVFAFAETSPTEATPEVHAAPLGSWHTPSPRSNPGRPLIEEASLSSTASTSPTDLLVSSAPPLAQIAPIASVSGQQRGETHMEMTTRDGSKSLSVKVEGTIEFTDDDNDIKSLSPGGHFRIEEETSLSHRAYDVKADGAGNLTQTYSVDATARPLDAEGKAWLAHLLPQIIRDSGVGAAPRVARILREGGPEAVIHEVGLIHSDGSKRIYLQQLFAQAKLNIDQLKEAAQLIRGISSDGDKAQVLIDVDGNYFTPELRNNLFDAAESISSDGDKRRVLSDILKKDAASDDTFLGVARTAKHISSDGDKAEVLIEMASPYRNKSDLPAAYFEAVKSVSSDGDHARVLLALLGVHGDDRETLVRVLKSAETISSDGDKARVLKQAVSHYSDSGIITRAFMDAANSIASDGDHQQVLVALIHRQDLGTATVDEITKSAKRISSDGDKARVLIELLQANVEPARDDYFAATDTISSDGDHSRVLMSLLDKSNTSPVMAVAAIQSAARMASDGDKGRVLLDAAHRYSKDAQVDQALRKALESMHSDGEYRSIMSEIGRPKEAK